MDNGPLQKEQVLKIKQLFSQTSRSKRRRKRAKSDTTHFECGSPQKFPLLASVNEVPLEGTTDSFSNLDVFGIEAIEITSLDETLWDNGFDYEFFVSQPMFSPNSFTTIPTPSRTVDSLDWEQPSLSTGSTSIVSEYFSTEAADAHYDTAVSGWRFKNYTA